MTHQPESPPNPFPIPEQDLAIQLGVPRWAIRKKRADFKAGIDWEVVGGQIAWASAAASILAREMASPSAQAQPPEKSAPVTLTVAAVALPNPILLACVLPDQHPGRRENWKMVRVLPQGRHLFALGMSVRACPVPGELGWRFLGNPSDPVGLTRYPRRPGHWL